MRRTDREGNVTRLCTRLLELVSINACGLNSYKYHDWELEMEFSGEPQIQV